jgi:hypothetical protein
MADIATFLATFPPIMSAIKVDGAGGGMRIQFDVPESEMGEAVKLLMWREVGLKVTIEPVNDGDNHEWYGQTDSGTIGNG